MILHLDMDAFFASVEQLDNPELRGKCVIVGGQSDRGVVAAASYEARKYGIHSAMPIFQARKRCKDLVIVTPHRHRYSELSKKMMAILNDFTPLVEQVSIDEAYMDISGCSGLFGPPIEMARRIKREIKQSIHLNCSVGVAPVKFLAKIASDLDKPDGLYLIKPEDVDKFIQTLPIGKVPGVGKKSRAVLDRMGIKNLGQIRSYSEAAILRKFGKFGKRLMELAQGIDSTTVSTGSVVKSISSEKTLSADTADKDLLAQYLLSQSEEVGRQLRKKMARARTVVLKLKYADFKQITRSETLSEPTQVSEVIYHTARKLLFAHAMVKRVRLIGVGVSGLVFQSVPAQMDLFGSGREKDENWEKVDKALDMITGKFGKDAIGRASLTGDIPKR